MSSSIRNVAYGEQALRGVILSLVQEQGTDPRPFRQGLARVYKVGLDRVDAAIEELAPVGCDDPTRHSAFIHSRAGQRFFAADVLDHE